MNRKQKLINEIARTIINRTSMLNEKYEDMDELEMTSAEGFLNMVEDGATLFTEIALKNFTLKNKNLENVSFEGGKLEHITFINCTFVHDAFRDCMLDSVRFIDCEIQSPLLFKDASMIYGGFDRCTGKLSLTSTKHEGLFFSECSFKILYV